MEWEKMTKQAIAEAIFDKFAEDQLARPSATAGRVAMRLPNGDVFGIPRLRAIPALQLLVDLGFLQQPRPGMHGLDVLGIEALTDREVLRRALYKDVAQPTASQVINIGSMHGPSQIGNHNEMNVTT